MAARDNVDVYNADMHAIGRAEFLKSTSDNFIFTSNSLIQTIA